MPTANNIKDLKYDIVEDVLKMTDINLVCKIRKYINRIHQQSQPNATTLQAMKDAEEGNTIHCDSFEDYLNSVR